MSYRSGTVEAPFWSYQLGLQEGFMPPDPRDSVGICQQQGVTNVWTPPLQSWQTGGAGAGTINPTWYSSLGQFPPTTLPNIDAAAITNLPTYTGTGSVITLPPPTYTPLNPQTTIDAGDGWKDPQDTAPAYAPVAGCPYLDPWSGVGAPIPSAPCPGAAPAPPPKRHWPLPTAVH
jgi:glucan 1,3-beta-glucosidase